MSSKKRLAGAAARDSFRALKDHPGTFLLPAAILSAPMLPVSFYSATQARVGVKAMELLVSAVLGVLIAYVITMRARAVTRPGDAGGGERVGLGLEAGLGRYAITALLFNVLLLCTILAALTPVLIIVGLLVGSGGPGLVIAGLLSLLSIPLVAGAVIFVYLRFVLGQPASALEGLRPVAALTRGWEVSKGRSWDLVLLGLIGIAASLVVGFLVSGPIAMVSSPPVPALDPNGPFDPELVLRELGREFAGNPLGPAAAAVVAAATYLTGVLVAPIPPLLLTFFFLQATGAPVEPAPPAEPAPQGAARWTRQGSPPETEPPAEPEDGLPGEGPEPEPAAEGPAPDQQEPDPPPPGAEGGVVKWRRGGRPPADGSDGPARAAWDRGLAPFGDQVR